MVCIDNCHGTTANKNRVVSAVLVIGMSTFYRKSKVFFTGEKMYFCKKVSKRIFMETRLLGTGSLSDRERERDVHYTRIQLPALGLFSGRRRPVGQPGRLT